jgi:uncharacterized membrane protein YczE
MIVCWHICMRAHFPLCCATLRQHQVWPDVSRSALQLAMSSLAFLLSTVVSKASTAVNLGFVVFVIGWIMQVAARSFLCLFHVFLEQHSSCYHT